MICKTIESPVFFWFLQIQGVRAAPIVEQIFLDPQMETNDSHFCMPFRLFIYLRFLYSSSFLCFSIHFTTHLNETEIIIGELLADMCYMYFWFSYLFVFFLLVRLTHTTEWLKEFDWQKNRRTIARRWWRWRCPIYIFHFKIRICDRSLNGLGFSCCILLSAALQETITFYVPSAEWCQRWCMKYSLCVLFCFFFLLFISTSQ